MASCNAENCRIPSVSVATRPQGIDRSAIRVLATMLLLAGLSALSPFESRGAVTEWDLIDQALTQRTTFALTRYYTDVKPKGAWVRYINQNVSRLHYRLRGSRTQTDTLGQLVSVSLGQFKIFTVAEIRIALGDDLYTSLLLSRNDPRSEEENVYIGDSFGHDDWSGEHQGIISLDRFDYHINPTLGAFVGLGAPESNLSWWNDGTLRIGVTSPQWEFALLAPLGSGADPVGPLRERLLAPGYGASASARLGEFVGRVRFTVLSEAAFSSAVIAPASYVHTRSLQGVYQKEAETFSGLFRFNVGVGFEEFVEVWRDVDGTPIEGERTRRLSPIAEALWTIPGGNVQLGLGVADLAMRGSASVRLTGNFWFELRAVSNEIFHAPEPFEHPFILFLTPRLKF